MIFKLSKLSIVFLVLFSCTITFVSCEKDDPTDDMSMEDPGETEGRFSGSISCSIIPTPASLGLNTTYTKYLNCTGIPVVGSAQVPDEALQIASQSTAFMLTGIGLVQSKLISEGAYIILYEEGLGLNDVAESGGNQQSTAAGVYISNPNQGLNLLISPATNLLCDASNGQAEGNILIHELAHMIDIGGYRRLDPSFASTLSSTFNNARAAGKWNNTYAATNKEEYFAETVAIWFGSNWIGPVGGDGFRNDIGTRAKLQSYDAGVYNLHNNNITSLTNVPGCREPVIDGVTANCPNTITDIDGNVYDIVNIGPMCWMKENLRTTRYKNGDPIANIEDENEWATATQGAWSYYDNDSNLDANGKLYNALAATNPAGLCPDGWRVPTIQELNDLTQYAGGNYASKALKQTGEWPTGATNTSGFSALPAGWRHESGFFSGKGSSSFFVSRILNSSQQPYGTSIFDDQDFIFINSFNPNFGSSCRCIKDE